MKRALSVMKLKEKLSRRIGMEGIFEILRLVNENEEYRQQLYRLAYDSDERVAYQALWVCSHFGKEENRWLFSRQNELIDGVMACRHPGKRRIFLNLLNRQPLENPPRTDFLDYCLERMVSSDELPGVRTLAMKLAYQLCRQTPELLNEFRLKLEMIDIAPLPRSIQAVHRSLFKAIRASNSVRKGRTTDE